MVELGAVKDKVASVLLSGPDGQRQGRAFAGALRGAVNPSGRLNFTWYRDGSQLPPMSDYDLAPGKTGGLGRTYQYFTGTPDYRFGFGLSYTRFRWSKIRVDRPTADVNDTARVTLVVTNAGSRAGADVVHVYAKTPKIAGREVPIRRLVGFRKTRELAPGASQRSPSTSPSRTRCGCGTTRRSDPGLPGRLDLRGVALGRRRRAPAARPHVGPHRPVHPPPDRPGSEVHAEGRRHTQPARHEPVAPGSRPNRHRPIRRTSSRPSARRLLRRPREGKLRYRSSNPRVVMVTAAGRLTARSAGVATVSVSLDDKTARIAFAVH